MKVYLKSDWDYPPSYEKNRQLGHFAGREKEKSELVDEFLRKDSGTILVSGARGVGKTALLFKAVQEATLKDERIVPIVINASQLDLHWGIKAETLPAIILKNLIRRLYGYFQADTNQEEKKRISPELYSKLGDLYKKARAKEYEASVSASEINQEEAAETKATSQEISSQINKKNLLNLFYVLGAIILLLPPLWSRYVNVALGIFLFLLPDFTIKNIETAAKERAARSNRTQSAESLYKEDASLSNLEYELNAILDALLKEDIKVIFVIDELDKLEGDANGEEGKIFDIIKTFKNLFTLSSALFVFITSNHAYEKIIQAREERKADYTLFTNRIFINRPDFNDLEKFIDSIILKIEQKDGTSIDKDFKKTLSGDELVEFRNFRNYLCYRARSDYFELSLIIRDYISSYEDTGGKRLPVIVLETLGFDERLKSKLQKALGQIFSLSQVKEQSEWHKNDAILSSLYKFLQENYNKSFEYPVSNPNNATDLIGDFLIPYLERTRIIQNTQTKNATPTPPQPINIPAQLIKVYQWTGNVPGENGVPDLLASPQELFVEEEKFIEEGGKYIQIINDLDDVENNPEKIIDGTFEIQTYGIDTGISETRDAKAITGINAYNIYTKYKNQLDGLTDIPPKHFNRNELIAFTKELEEEIKKIKDVAFTAFTNLLGEMLKEKSVLSTKQTLQLDPELFATIQDLRNLVISGGIQHFVFYKNEPPKSKQLLIVRDIDPVRLSKEIVKLLHNNKSYKVVNIQTNPAFDYTTSNQFEQTSERITKKGKKIIDSKIETTDGFLNINAMGSPTIFILPLRQLTDWLSS